MPKTVMSPHRLIHLCDVALADAELINAQDKTKECLEKAKAEEKVWWRPRKDFKHFYDNYTERYNWFYEDYIRKLKNFAVLAKQNECSDIVLDHSDFEKLYYVFDYKRRRADAKHKKLLEV